MIRLCSLQRNDPRWNPGTSHRLLHGMISALALAALLMSGTRGAAAQVPTPASVIGFEPGSDYKLADHSQLTAYFEALDAASDRVVVERIGESTQGRPMMLVLISSEENLADRARYQEISRRLATAEDMGEAEAHRLAAEGKAIVWIDAGLHATEVAHAQHAPLFAHWLATDEGDQARRVREDAIVLLMPVMNPDGLDIVTDWYRRNLGTPFETVELPRLYHPYVGHDNNRDWNLFTQRETRVVARQLYHEWFPQIVFNHHQRSPFPGRIWVPPVENPINPNLDPVVVASINQIGEFMKKRFAEEDKPGVVSGIVFDGWGSMYMSDAPNYHNMLGFITETALYRYATPHCYDAEDIPDTFGPGGDYLPAKDPTTQYPDPWLGGCWHLFDATDYMMTASQAVAELGAVLNEQWLYNIWRTGRRQIQRGQRAQGGPFAWVIDPSAQHDRSAVTEMLRSLRWGGIEVIRSDRPFEAGGQTYPEGSYVIGPQAFRPFAADLLDPKTYPERSQYPGGPPDPPYDMTGYELPLLFGVDVARVNEPFDITGEAVDEIPVPDGGVAGSGDWGYLLSWAPNASVRAVNRLLAEGATVRRATTSFDAAGRSWPAGTVTVQDVDRASVATIGEEEGLWLHAVRREPDATLGTGRAPRVGLYQSYVASMPEGWTRWVLEEYGFEYRTLHDADIRESDLSMLDVIILPDQSLEDLLNGHVRGTMPAEFTGGIGVEGALALKRFVEAGGWIVAADRAVDFAIRMFGLPVRNVAGDDLFIPGSLIRMRADSTDPLAWGVSGTPIALFVRSQVLEVIPGAEEGDQKIERDVDTYVSFADEDPLASGWATGLDQLQGKAAAMRVPLGQGQVVLLGVSPHFRASPQNTFKLLFNPLLSAANAAEPWGDPER